MTERHEAHCRRHSHLAPRLADRRRRDVDLATSPRSPAPPARIAHRVGRCGGSEPPRARMRGICVFPRRSLLRASGALRHVVNRPLASPHPGSRPRSSPRAAEVAVDQAHGSSGSGRNHVREQGERRGYQATFASYKVTRRACSTLGNLATGWTLPSKRRGTSVRSIRLRQRRGPIRLRPLRCHRSRSRRPRRSSGPHRAQIPALPRRCCTFIRKAAPFRSGKLPRCKASSFGSASDLNGDGRHSIGRHLGVVVERMGLAPRIGGDHRGHRRSSS